MKFLKLTVSFWIIVLTPFWSLPALIVVFVKGVWDDDRDVKGVLSGEKIFLFEQ